MVAVVGAGVVRAAAVVGATVGAGAGAGAAVVEGAAVVDGRLVVGAVAGPSIARESGPPQAVSTSTATSATAARLHERPTTQYFTKW